MKQSRLIPAVALVFAACGGGDAPDAPPAEAPPEAPAPAPAGPAAPTGPLSMPDWYTVDHDNQTVVLAIEAGTTPDNNYWNYNGYTNGQIAISVPVGYTVDIELTNSDPNMAHSVGISSELSNFTMPPSPEPVFAGAISSNPQSMVDATMPGEVETITFVADQAGNYSMVCYIAGHSAVGMWLFFDVSADNEAGVRGM
ncbi:MAG: sulfocyanin-like copper-binding protein [Gemmatimonadota bacterium]